MNKLILVSGKKETGKSTFSELIKLVDNPFINLSYARKLKIASYYIMKYVLLCNITLDHFYDVNMKKKAVKIFRIGPKITTRTFLQWFGTNVVRKIYELFWVSLLVKDMKKKYINKNIIIDDVRFPNEIEYTKEKLEKYFDITTIRINRDLPYTDTHISETALDDYKDFNYFVDNNGTLSSLDKKVKKILKEIN